MCWVNLLWYTNTQIFSNSLNYSKMSHGHSLRQYKQRCFTNGAIIYIGPIYIWCRVINIYLDKLCSLVFGVFCFGRKFGHKGEYNIIQQSTQNFVSLKTQLSQNRTSTQSDRGQIWSVNLSKRSNGIIFELENVCSFKI